MKVVDERRGERREGVKGEEKCKQKEGKGRPERGVELEMVWRRMRRIEWRERRCLQQLERRDRNK